MTDEEKAKYDDLSCQLWYYKTLLEDACGITVVDVDLKEPGAAERLHRIFRESEQAYERQRRMFSLQMVEQAAAEVRSKLTATVLAISKTDEVTCSLCTLINGFESMLVEQLRQRIGGESSCADSTETTES